MKEERTSATICVKDKLGIQYKLCRLDQVIREDGHYYYSFRPDYSIIDMLSPPLYQGIPGLDLDLRKEEYLREDMIPVFISERTPNEKRIEVQPELLESVGMDRLNRLEWLIRTDLQYFGDNFYAIRYEEPKTVDLRELELTFRNMAVRILKEICAGNEAILPHVTIDSGNRTAVYYLLTDILAKNDSKIRKQRNSGELPSLGRKRKDISAKDIKWVKRRMDMRLMTAQQAADRLGIGRATLFRRLKETE